MTDSGGLRPLKRFITSHNHEGKAVFSSTLPDDNECRMLPSKDAAFALGYTTKGWPVDLDSDRDIATYSATLSQPPGLVISGGSVLRTVDIKPGLTSPMHRTQSIDYGIVIEGEIELILDSGETRMMKRGDVAVQRGTNHAWRNASETEWARMTYVLLPCKPVYSNGVSLGEDLGDMEGVPNSQ